jgi:hypothetical protein
MGKPIEVLGGLPVEVQAREQRGKHLQLEGRRASSREIANERACDE